MNYAQVTNYAINQNYITLNDKITGVTHASLDDLDVSQIIVCEIEQAKVVTFVRVPDPATESAKIFVVTDAGGAISVDKKVGAALDALKLQRYDLPTQINQLRKEVVYATKSKRVSAYKKKYAEKINAYGGAHIAEAALIGLVDGPVKLELLEKRDAVVRWCARIDAALSDLATQLQADGIDVATLV